MRATCTIPTCSIEHPAANDGLLSREPPHNVLPQIPVRSAADHRVSDTDACGCSPHGGTSATIPIDCPCATIRGAPQREHCRATCRLVNRELGYRVIRVVSHPSLAGAQCDGVGSIERVWGSIEGRHGPACRRVELDDRVLVSR